MFLHADDHDARWAERQHDGDAARSQRVGKRTLTMQLPVPVQRRASGTAPPSAGEAAAGPDPFDFSFATLAEQGTRGGGGALPYLDTIQRSFGAHDVRAVEAHTGADAGQAARSMGALAFATGNHVAFAGAPDLHTAAHEAAHVVQQRAGVHLAGGVGEVGDRYERHADAVADRVVAGESAEALLDELAPTRAAEGGTAAVQRRVDPGAAPSTKVRVIATGDAGIILEERDGGYEIGHAAGGGAVGHFLYDDLDPRDAGAFVATPVTNFANLGHVPGAWWATQFPPNDFNIVGPKLFAQSPVARGDMHDIRAVLEMDPEIRVLIGLTNVAVYGGDVNTIVAYYQGIPNFAQRVAVVTATADNIRLATGAQLAATATPVLRWLRQQRRDAGGLAELQAEFGRTGIDGPLEEAHARGEQQGHAQFVGELANATTGPANDDDDFDCMIDLMRNGFTPDAPYVLVNWRDSGHNPGPGRPASHPEHDTGAVGFWDLMALVLEAGYQPVPMGQAPGVANWPGPSLIGYFGWPSCVANQRRNKRQAEYYLLRALRRFNPNVQALAWRSGVTDAISFAGIPVMALDVHGSGGAVRASTRQQMLPGHYRQVNLSDRSANLARGVHGWIGRLTANDTQVVLQALGQGPRAADVDNLRQRTDANPLSPLVSVVMQQLVALCAQHPPDQLRAALDQLQPHEQVELGQAMPYAKIVAIADLVIAAANYAAQAGPQGFPPQLPQATQDAARTTAENTTAVGSLDRFARDAEQARQQAPVMDAPIATVFADLAAIMQRLLDLMHAAQPGPNLDVVDMEI